MALVTRVVNGKKIIEDENVIREVKCFSCRWLIWYPKCAAFEEIIPNIIRNGFSDHTLPLNEMPGYKGVLEKTDENGKPIIFEPFPRK
jgi:hypothetical protein